MKKIVCILIMSLFIATTFTAIGETNVKNNSFEEVSKPILLTRECFSKTEENKANLNFEYEYIQRDRIIENAEAYTNYEWYPTEDNVLHGNCPICDERVDTTDRDYYTSWPDYWGWNTDQVNIGVPYQVEGFSSISGLNLTNPEDFYEQYTGTGAYEGIIHYGGDTYFDKPEGCTRACGIDCSGFVSRCWNLAEKHYTRYYPPGLPGLPNASSPVKFDELKPGDLLNSQGFHAILFKEFLDEDSFIAIDAGGVSWQVSEFTCNVTYISEDGFSIRLEGQYYDYTENFGNQLFSTLQYNFISDTPVTPTIIGQTSGNIDVEYEYTFNSVDPDGDNVKYYIEWGDGNSEETDFSSSGTDVKLKHIWSEKGDYAIKAKAEDTSGLVSGWRTLDVNMPRNREMSNNLISELFERFPIIRQILTLLS